jgi:hypothetical protein
MVSPRTSHDAKGLTQRSTEWPDGRSTQALAISRGRRGTARYRRTKSRFDGSCSRASSAPLQRHAIASRAEAVGDTPASNDLCV